MRVKKANKEKMLILTEKEMEEGKMSIMPIFKFTCNTSVILMLILSQVKMGVMSSPVLVYRVVFKPSVAIRSTTFL